MMVVAVVPRDGLIIYPTSDRRKSTTIISKQNNGMGGCERRMIAENWKWPDGDDTRSPIGKLVLCRSMDFLFLFSASATVENQMCAAHQTDYQVQYIETETNRNLTVRCICVFR